MGSRLKFPHLVEKAGRLYLELRSTRKVAENKVKQEFNYERETPKGEWV